MRPLTNALAALSAAAVLAGVAVVVWRPAGAPPPFPGPLPTTTIAAPPLPPADVAAIVTMTNDNLFVPLRVTVRAGQAVEWRNTSIVMHTVTADPERAAQATSYSLPPGAAPFHSGDMYDGDAFRHTFTTPGEYKYFCQPHEAHGMVGWVDVTD